ncbi:MAG TPA: DMT family transporter [Nitrososphaeraceae archaeon]|nr:DMT family transporter [Nitrososphaeraceae archaeon]
MSYTKGNFSIGYVCATVTAMLFGFTFSMAKQPLENVDPIVLSAIVYPISFAALIPITKSSFKIENKEDFLDILVISILGGVLAPILLFYGLDRIDASEAVILTNAQIIFTVLLSSLFFGEKPNGIIGYTGIIIVFVGLFVATTELDTSGSLFKYEPGKIMIVGAMLVWAIDNNISRRLTKRSTIWPAKIAMLKFLIGGIILFGIATIAVEESSSSFPSRLQIIDSLLLIKPSEWLIIIAVSLFGFAGALSLLLESLKRIGTIRTMMIFSLTPIFGIVAANIVHAESISILEAIATGIIIIGIFMVSKSYT